MNLPRFSVRYPVTVTMIMLGIGLLGIISLSRLGTDLLPSIYNPRIVVELRSGDRSPQDMEQRFGRKLEGELGTVSRVIDVQTLCSPGRVMLTVTFTWGTNMDFALLDVQKKVAAYEADPEVDQLTIARYDPQEEPIMVYAMLSSGEHDLDALRRMADNLVKRNLERLDGVARVQLAGGLKKEVRIQPDAYLLEAYGLKTADLITAVRQANINTSGGKLVQDKTSYLIKGIGEYASLDDIRTTVIGQRSTADSTRGNAGKRDSQSERVPIFLADVAEVAMVPAGRSSLVRYNGKEGVGLYIYKESHDNTVRVSREVEGVMAKMQQELPGVSFMLINSHATFIDTAIGEVRSTALIGALLAMLVLYAFLRHAGVTLIASLAIPISILATFTLMYFQKLTLNIMTLGGLALGAGMLVDNAIVVIENIFRRRSLGEDADTAAANGTTEVATALVASTLTTVVVFLPVVYVQGVAAELFREQALVVAWSLLSSLLVAFLLIPTLAARLFKHSPQQRFSAMRLRLPFYEKMLALAMQNKGATVAIAVVMLASAALLLPRIGTEFVPRSSQNQLILDIELPPGSPLDKTSAVAEGAALRLRALLGDAVQGILTTINAGAAQDLLSGRDTGGENRASLILLLGESRQSSPELALERLQQNFSLPGASHRFRIRETSLQQTIGTGGAPVAVEIRGGDLHQLRRLSDGIAGMLAASPLLTSIETSFHSSRPEITLRIDRLLSSSLGLDIRQVSEIVRNRLAGEVISTYYGGGENRDIRLRFPPATLPELQDMTIRTPAGALVRLRDIAEFEMGDGPAEITRHNQSRVARVTALLQQDAALSEAIRWIAPRLENIELPPGYELRFAGEEAARQESFAWLNFALLLSVVLVYMVLASLFESFLHPFTILLTLPLAGVGVVYAFWLSGHPLSIMALLGVIMLAGIAANDSIVLVDYINRLRAQGTARTEAILQAGRDRLRPIVMTSLTTILALLPLTIGFGEGAKLRAPLAIAVIGGLVTSTLLTLIVIPVVYDLIDRLRGEKS